jgi:DNA polymerase-3 subunit beta
MLEIVKLLKPNDKITVVVGENVVAFKTDGLSITTRALGGTYPAYKRLVPTEFKTKLKINTLQLKDSVERASLVSANGTSLVTLEYAGGKLIVSQNNECGKLREEFAVDIEGENFKQNFNARYLTDMLRFTPSEEIQLAYTGELTPLVMIPADLKSISILLPVRTPAPAAA